MEPLVRPSSVQDGHAAIEHPFPGGPRAREKAFLRQAEAAVARGRLRDAERGLLAACRENLHASASATVPLARVLGTLGEHYTGVAQREASPVLRDQLVTRARHVLELSAKTYETALGPNASRSREARQRVARLEQRRVAGPETPPLDGDGMKEDAPPAKPQAALAVRPDPRAEASAPPRITNKPRVAARRTDADGDAQRETREAGRDAGDPASDPALRQLAADLERLRAQAEAVSDDPAGFRRRSDLAQAQRDQCKDAACKHDWHAKRRLELLAEF